MNDNNTMMKEVLLWTITNQKKRKNGKSIPIIVICKNSKVAANMMELKINNMILKKDATKKSIYELMVSPKRSITLASLSQLLNLLVIEK